jgi:hypothetical protein
MNVFHESWIKGVCKYRHPTFEIAKQKWSQKSGDASGMMYENVNGSWQERDRCLTNEPYTTDIMISVQNDQTASLRW